MHWCFFLVIKKKLVLHISCAFVTNIFFCQIFTFYLLVKWALATSWILTGKSTRKPENKNCVNKQFASEGLESMLGVIFHWFCHVQRAYRTKTRSSQVEVNIFRGLFSKNALLVIFYLYYWGIFHLSLYHKGPPVVLSLSAPPSPEVKDN